MTLPTICTALALTYSAECGYWQKFSDPWFITIRSEGLTVARNSHVVIERKLAPDKACRVVRRLLKGQ